MSVFLHFLRQCLFAGLLLLPFGLLAQQQTISGRVIGAGGEALPGVSIVLKATGPAFRQRGTTTNAEGRYSLPGIPTNATLTFSYIGYASQDIEVGNRSVVDVTLQNDDRALNEVVVVGYGTQRKAETTGSIASVKAADINITPNANLAQGLQSRVAGVQITQNSAAPGGSVSIRIRGINSINGTSEPLYVIDGIQISNNSGNGANSVSPLSQINPGDIESIDVLKDASSTAIYGSRGANGVVLITTKRGKTGRTSVNYDGYYGVQNATKKIDVLKASDFALLENETYKRAIYADPASLGTGTDWQSLVLRQATMQNHQLSISSGSEKTRFLLSGNYFNQDGVIRTTNFTRYSLRLNLDHSISDRVRVGTSIMASVNQNSGISTANGSNDVTGTTNGILGAAIAAPPTLVPYRDDGSVWPFQDQFNGNYREVINPIGLLSEKRRNTTRRTLANVYADVTLTKGLTYRASFNIDLANGLDDFYSPRSILSESQLQSGGGSASKTNNYNQTLLHESILTYTTKIGEAHSVKFTGVLASQKNQYESNNASAGRFPNDATENNALQLGTERSVSSSKSADRLDSYLARVNYGFRDRYFIDLTGRVDGASKFGANNKYGFFPAIGAAWRIIEEPFLKNQSVISDLKLRGSWGITGNAGAIGPYGSLATVSQGNNYQFGGQLAIGIVPTGIPNPDLRWERSTQWNVGVDMALLNNRISLVADVYNKRTDDLLFVKTLPQSSGYSSIVGNFASIQNKGIELALNARISNGAVKWDLSPNISFNRNKVLSLDGGTTNEVSRGFVSYLIVGQPIGVYKSYIWDGIYQTGDAFIPGDNGRLGGARVKDVNGDGKITSDDLVVTGNPNPNYIFGLTSNLRWKGLDLTVFVQGVQGNQLWNNLRYNLENPLGQRNLFAGLVNRWSPTNPSNDYVSGFQAGRLPLANRFVEDGSFVRLKTVTLGYTLPKFKGIQNARVYVSGTNLLTFTNYQGFDPEVNTFGGNSGNTLIGVDNGVYPVARTFLIGLQVGL